MTVGKITSLWNGAHLTVQARNDQADLYGAISFKGWQFEPTKTCPELIDHWRYSYANFAASRSKQLRCSRVIDSWKQMENSAFILRWLKKICNSSG